MASLARSRPTPAKLARIRSRRKLGEEVTQQVRDAIMSGAYLADEKLVVERLSAQLGVSTMPVREGLVALAHEGLVHLSPRHGFRVAPLRKQDVADVFRVQAFIASIIGQRAAAIIDDQQLGQLVAIHGQIEALSRLDGLDVLGPQIEALNFKFHHVINHVVDAPRLRWLLRITAQYVPRHVYETIPTWSRLTIADHPKILEAFTCHDAQLAGQRVKDHIMNAGIQLVENLEARGFWT